VINEIPIHVINLARRVDRKLNVIKELEKQGLTNYTFHTAIDGTTLDANKLHITKIADLNIVKLLRGQYGCYLSHLNIYNEILISSHETHLILEDDVYFTDNFIERANYILAKNLVWDIFYLGINQFDNMAYRGKYFGPIEDGIYCPKYPIWGTHGYLIKKQTIKTTTDFLPILFPIDKKLMYSNINRLTLKNTIIKTRNEYSDTNP